MSSPRGIGAGDSSQTNSGEQMNDSVNKAERERTGSSPVPITNRKVNLASSYSEEDGISIGTPPEILEQRKQAARRAALNEQNTGYGHGFFTPASRGATPVYRGAAEKDNSGKDTALPESIRQVGFEVKIDVPKLVGSFKK